MLNTNNYFSKAASINWDNLPEALSKGHKLVEGASQNNWAAYNSNENIKRVVDAFFQKLNDYVDKNPSAVPAASKSLPSKTEKAAPKAATAKPTPATRKMPPKKAAVEKEEYDSEDVELIDTDVQFIKRYAAMHGKVKSQAQILTLLHSLQKAIIERRIGKDSPYAKEIDMMQKQLISCYEKMGDMAEIKIDSKNLKRYLEIAHSQEGMFSVALLKSYIALNGKRDVKDRSQRLFNRIKKAVEQGKITKSDKYADKLNEAYQTLKNYNDGDSAMLNINKAQLNGLMGILGENLFQKKSLNGLDDDNGMIVSSGELLAMDFQTIGLQGRYKELIGDPSVGFTAMVYGLPKSGKSTMCLDFANYLAANHGKVLYCAIEEGFGYTLKEKIERLKAHHSNLYITDRVPENLNDFHFVFIDSVSKAGMDVNDIDSLRKMHPVVSFIFIYHTTKEGKFKGVNEHAHEVDVIVQVEKGKATSTGRFNAGGVMEIN
jgi:deoxyadenosine/deoxycytidine kinase